VLYPIELRALAKAADVAELTWSGNPSDQSRAASRLCDPGTLVGSPGLIPREERIMACG
jgi:hypothetical protein